MAEEKITAPKAYLDFWKLDTKATVKRDPVLLVDFAPTTHRPLASSEAWALYQFENHARSAAGKMDPLSASTCVSGILACVELARKVYDNFVAVKSLPDTKYKTFMTEVEALRSLLENVKTKIQMIAMGGNNESDDPRADGDRRDLYLETFAILTTMSRDTKDLAEVFDRYPTSRWGTVGHWQVYKIRHLLKNIRIEGDKLDDILNIWEVRICQDWGLFKEDQGLHTMKLNPPPQETAGGIAIVGTGCRTPGTNDLQGFWETLANSGNVNRRMPEDRFTEDWKVHKHLGLPDDFDATFFNVHPSNNATMDPQQRLFLMTAYDALENAGMLPDVNAMATKDINYTLEMCDPRFGADEDHFNIGTRMYRAPEIVSNPAGDSRAVLHGRTVIDIWSLGSTLPEVSPWVVDCGTRRGIDYKSLEVETESSSVVATLSKRRRRRESHNMIQRRRRDNINERIQELSGLIPPHRLEEGKVDKTLEPRPPQYNSSNVACGHHQCGIEDEINDMQEALLNRTWDDRLWVAQEAHLATEHMDISALARPQLSMFDVSCLVLNKQIGTGLFVDALKLSVLFSAIGSAIATVSHYPPIPPSPMASYWTALAAISMAFSPTVQTYLRKISVPHLGLLVGLWFFASLVESFVRHFSKHFCVMATRQTVFTLPPTWMVHLLLWIGIVLSPSGDVPDEAMDLAGSTAYSWNLGTPKFGSVLFQLIDRLRRQTSAFSGSTTVTATTFRRGNSKTPTKTHAITNQFWHNPMLC